MYLVLLFWDNDLQRDNALINLFLYPLDFDGAVGVVLGSVLVMALEGG
jgi:hypothetical protein